MSTVQIWMMWIMGMIIVLDVICVYGHSRKNKKK